MKINFRDYEGFIEYAVIKENCLISKIMSNEGTEILKESIELNSKIYRIRKPLPELNREKLFHVK